MRDRETWTWKRPEFILVVAMLSALIVLAWGVLWIPIEVSQGDTTTKLVDVLDYRRSILVVIATAFVAWVGAGAAYFFARESLREAASSLAATREPSARERPRWTPVRDIPPRMLEWTVKEEDSPQSVIRGLEDHPDYWFITVVRSDGSLRMVLEEEAIWRFVNGQLTSGEKNPGEAYTAAMSKTVKELLEADKLRRFRDRYVPARPDSNAVDVHAWMEDRGGVRAVILDEEGRPTHFFTTGDVWSALLRDS